MDQFSCSWMQSVGIMQLLVTPGQVISATVIFAGHQKHTYKARASVSDCKWLWSFCSLFPHCLEIEVLLIRCRLLTFGRTLLLILCQTCIPQLLRMGYWKITWSPVIYETDKITFGGDEPFVLTSMYAFITSTSIHIIFTSIV